MRFCAVAVRVAQRAKRQVGEAADRVGHGGHSLDGNLRWAEAVDGRHSKIASAGSGNQRNYFVLLLFLSDCLCLRVSRESIRAGRAKHANPTVSRRKLTDLLIVQMLEEPTLRLAAHNGQTEECQRMDEATKGKSNEVGRGLLACLIIPLALLLVAVVLGQFDRTTELTPSHDGAMQFTLLIAGAAGLACGGISIRESKGMAVWRRILTACSLVLLGFIAVFLLSSRVADLVEARVDFPPGKTRTYPGLQTIWRAYRTHGKGQSWNIQTTPLWSNLEVTESDYEFMLAHRNPEDRGRNPDEISSHGFLCARVTLEQSGNALRVLHAGNQKLPAGTVIVCPKPIAGRLP